MRVLVTGGRGFIGSALCAELARRGDEVVTFRSAECDLTKPGTLDRCVDGVFDRIYHLAAWTQAGDFCLRHPGEQWVINQQLNTNVLDYWQRVQPKAKLIAMGTSCAYAPGSNLVESEYLDGEPIDSLYTYAMTKRMLLVGMRALQKQFGLAYLCVVPSTVYGPEYPADGRQMHFIFDLIAKILRGRDRGEPVVLWGHGNQKRELIHRDDFVQQLVALADHVENEIVNVGSGEEHSIREFAQIICDVVGYPFEKIEFDLTRYVGAESKRLNVDKLRGYLPDYAPKPLAEGLAETIAWFERTKAHLR